MPIGKKSGAVIVVIWYLILATPGTLAFWLQSHSSLKYVVWILFLNCGTYLEVVAILAAMMVIRSVVVTVRSATTPEKPFGGRGLTVPLGIVTGLITAVVWWFVFQYGSGHAGQQDYALGRAEIIPGYDPRVFVAGIRYYRFYSVFIAVHLGILGGDLGWRWSSERRLFPYSPRKFRPSGFDFVWTSWVAWLALYRISEWIWLILIESDLRRAPAPPEVSVLSLLPFLATSMACIPVSCLLFLLTPKTKTSSVFMAMTASLLIPIVATPLLITTGFLAIAPLALCIVSVNIGGFIWGWIVGDLRWRSLQPR